MALFRTLSAPEPLPPITGEGIVLRGPQMADFAAWAELREASRKFLTPWEPTWPADDLTRPAFRQRLRRYAEDMRTDQAYPFFLFRTEDNALVGGLGAGQHPPRRRPGRQPRLLDRRPYVRRGYMTAAVRALIPAAFDVLRLHRVEAACIPTNLASVRLLEKDRLPARGLCPLLPVHQRDMAGPSAIRAAAERPERLMRSGRQAAESSGWPQPALGSPRSLCYKAVGFTWR